MQGEGGDVCRERGMHGERDGRRRARQGVDEDWMKPSDLRLYICMVVHAPVPHVVGAGAAANL